jgi:hypothetical protein
MDWVETMVDPIEWLLERNDPSVRYRALQDLMGLNGSHPEVAEAQEAVMRSAPVQKILSAQNEAGHWVDEKDMYLPKYTATTHSLLILAELGAKRIPPIENGMKHVFRFQRDSGHLLTELPMSVRGRASVVKDGCCLDANVLYYSIHFGYLDDPHVKKLIDFIVEYHDGEKAGWKCRSYPINPAGVFPPNCYMGAAKVLRALSMIPDHLRSRAVKDIIDREAENVLENGVYRYLRNPNGSRKDKAGWKRFGFPLFYQSDALELLDTLTRLGIKDDRMQGAVRLLLDARQPAGRWLMENTFNGKMWVDIEEKGMPSKWITLRALRVLKSLDALP